MADTQIPNTRNEIVEFYKQHAEIWSTLTTEIGISVELAAAVKAATDAAVLAQQTAVAQRNTAKMSTTDFYDKADALRAIGGAAVATIRAYAEATDDKEVYIKAEVSPPAPPTPPGPPVAPKSVTADPNATGTITLKIKGSVAKNASFHIERSVDNGPWVLVNPTRSKTWTDEAVPMNTNTITYRVFGVRDNKRSDNATSATVNFGNLPAALQAAFRSDAGPKREAA